MDLQALHRNRSHRQRGYVPNVPPGRGGTGDKYVLQKIRAFSDFALEVPYNPEKIKADLTAIEENLSDTERESLKTQIDHFEEDMAKYCG
mgnify:CR=1 FL=1